MMIALIATSCNDDGGDSNLNTNPGATPNITKDATKDGFIDLIAIENAGEANIGFTIDKGHGDIASMDIILYYISGTSVNRTLLEANVSTFPKTYSLTQNDLIEAFDNLNSAADFKLADQVVVTADITLTNGTILKMYSDDFKRNFGTDVSNSSQYKVSQVFPVSCPSDLGGNYKVVSSGNSTDSGPTQNPVTGYEYNVTIVDNGGGSYTVSDGLGGLYILWYAMYGVTFEVPGKFTDVCGEISGTFTGPFSEPVTYTGSTDPATGVITIDWENGFGDTATAVYTKI